MRPRQYELELVMATPLHLIVIRWTTHAEALLATCYVEISKDSLVKNDKDEQCFGGKVLNEFNSSSHHKRTKYMIDGEVGNYERSAFKKESKGKAFTQDGTWGILKDHSK
ncbi:hypothetical protein Tco_0163329 [Tanacetum coccineum]